MQAECQAREYVARRLPVDTLWIRFVFVDHAGIPQCKAASGLVREVRMEPV
jgi:hypothetical protein